MIEKHEIIIVREMLEDLGSDVKSLDIDLSLAEETYDFVLDFKTEDIARTLSRIKDRIDDIIFRN